MSCPCKGCQDRTITCHGVCQKYQSWRQNRGDVNNWLIKQRPLASESAMRSTKKKIIRKARGWEKVGGEM